MILMQRHTDREGHAQRSLSLAICYDLFPTCQVRVVRLLDFRLAAFPARPAGPQPRAPRDITGFDWSGPTAPKTYDL